MLNKKTVRDIEVSGKKVLLRCDFNVPLDRENKDKITSDKRIIESLKTIKYLISAGAKVILCSHIGKTGQNISLKPVAIRLSELLGQDVELLKDIIGDSVKEAISKMQNGDVVLLENVRMFKEEEENDPKFAKDLSSLADIYVNDAFGTAHRAHASTEGVAHYLPAVAGFLIEKEIAALDGSINNPQRPFLAIIGGSKISSKIGVITSLLEKVDTILIGGAMAYTFVKAQGGSIGRSLYEPDKVDLAAEILAKALEKEVKFMLPVDNVIVKEINENEETAVVESNKIPDEYMGVDIGPKTVSLYEAMIKESRTIMWNGPVGVYEIEKFAEGTKKIAIAMANSNAVTIIGGGDSAAAVEELGLESEMTHISTGGGASLEFIEGKTLPGIAALQDK